jgi:hypothetical protein
MTIRIYTVDRDGAVTGDSGTRALPVEPHPLPEAMNTQYPPCQCPRHRMAVSR